MLGGAWRSVRETDLKRVLAYSTVSALGLMMMLFGSGSDMAVSAAVVYLIAHSSYKGTLFLVAGTLEHETGTRDIRELGGLRQSMPAIALAGLLAALSMAGVPLLLGFIGKELVYDYNFILEERHTPKAKAQYPCYCGSKKCRGTILAKKR